MPYGQFWFGGNRFPGFLFKKQGGAGGRKNPKYGLICNQPTTLWNNYIPGAGIQSTNIATRRAKQRLAITAKYFIERPIIPIYVTLEQANEIYVRFPEAQTNIKLQNSIIDGNLIQNNDLLIESTTPDRVLVTDGNKNVVSSNVTSNSLSFLQGLTGNIQSQLPVKPIVYWNNTGEDLTQPNIYFGSVQSTSGTLTVNLPKAIPQSRRVDIILAVDSDSDIRPGAYLRTRGNSSFSFQCRSFDGNQTLQAGITCIWLSVGNDDTL
jgi:hypothetical protein